MADLFTAEMFSTLQSDLVTAGKVVIPVVIGLVSFRKIVAFVKGQIKTA